MDDRTSNRKYPPYERHVFVCLNERPPGHPRGCCKAKDSQAVLERFKELVENRKLKPRIRAQKAGCLDTCEMGVSVVVYPEAVWYARVSVEDVEEIVNSHLVNGMPVERLRMQRPSPEDTGSIKPIGNA